MSKETATAIHGDLKDLLGRIRDLQRAESMPLGFPAAFSLARYHVEHAARSLLPLVQREEDGTTREHMRNELTRPVVLAFGPDAWRTSKHGCPFCDINGGECERHPLVVPEAPVVTPLGHDCRPEPAFAEPGEFAPDERSNEPYRASDYTE